MTLAAVDRPASVDTAAGSGPRRSAREWWALGALLGATAVLYLWNLSASGWANAFYSAAAQAGAQNATAMLFGSSDAANAITVDKIPGALWVVDLSVRLFGLSSWSVLVPQALEGVAAVAVLYAAVRRVSGPGGALLAGAALALTPVAALIFRFNNPDALLVLLLVSGAYCVQRACASTADRPGGHAARWWLVAAGVAVGLAFLTKMLQALLVLPAFGAAYLGAGPAPWWRRLADTAWAAAAMVVSGGWYLLLVEWWPEASRPYIGGSQNNSIVELALGYNGLGRLTGDERGGLGNLNFDVGWGRLFGPGMGADIAWLLPAALVCLTAGLLITRRAPRTDLTRAALILWGGWLLITALVFSFMNGIVHSYYTVALAPAVAALIGIGVPLLWARRRDPVAATTLSAMVVVTVVLAAVLLGRQDWMPWLRGAVGAAGLGAATLLLVAGRLPAALARIAAGLALVACLAAPAAVSVATAAAPHATSVPSVGPARGGPGFGGPGFGGGLLQAPTPSASLTATLVAGAADYTWAAAVIGSNNAAGYQLATGAPVMAVGGFNGTDPAPTFDEFRDLVSQGRIHYFIAGKITIGARHAAESGGSRASSEIADWVGKHYRPRTVGGVVIYDLTQPGPDTAGT